ncbi:MAG: LysR family transcriptional regulator [Thiohalobacteraceae bacterium]
MARLEDMENFMRVVETGSISAAAERLGIAKSAVSRRLSDLEARLGVQLFRRTTRRLDITDSGRGFYERCLRILSDVDEAEQAVSQVHGRLVGRLRVAVPLSFGLLHLCPAINDFMVAHPGLEFDLDLNDRQVDLLAEGFDLAVRIADLEDSSLIARRLATMRTVVCASPEYLARAGVPESPSALAERDCLVYSNARDPALWRFRGPDGGERTVRVRVRMRANNGDFLRQAASAGQGVCILPTFIAFHAIETGTLTPILTDYVWPSYHAYAVYPQTRHLTRRVRVFVDYLAERFAGVPYWDADLKF